jgi:hypothetical protein
MGDNSILNKECIFNLCHLYWWREETVVLGVPGKNHWPVASHWQTLSHNIETSTPHHERDWNSQL